MLVSLGRRCRAVASMTSTWSPYLTRVGVLLLMAVATLGVATPRARVTARERVGRAVDIRRASPRINDRLGWVAPEPKLAEVDGDPRSDARPDRRLGTAHALTAPSPHDGSALPRPAMLAMLLRRTSSHVVSQGHRHRTFGRSPPLA